MHFLKVTVSQCTCLTGTSCFEMHKDGIILFKVQKKKKSTANIDPKISSSSNSRTMILSKCAICGSKKSRFIKKQEAKRLLSKLDIKTPLNTNTGWYFVLNVC